MSIFTGSAVALVTPFLENGDVDYDKLKELVEFHIAHKTDAIVICGTTGEASTLSHEEHLECVKKCVEFADHRIKVIAGTGSNCTATAIYLSTEAESYGVDGLLKGQMTHRATLGTDPRGNLTRIDNALAQMPQRLEAAKAQLDNLYQQQAAAKEEVGKPFLYEEELRSKNARLVELDTLLNIDGKGPAHDEAVVAKSTRPSVLDHLKRPVPPRSTDKKPKQHEEVR